MKKRKIYNRLLLMINAVLFCSLICLGWYNKVGSTSGQTNKIVIEDPNHSQYMEIGFKEGVGLLIAIKEKKGAERMILDSSGISFYNSQGQKKLVLASKDKGEITLYGQNNHILAQLESTSSDAVSLTLYDAKQTPRLHLQGGERPAMNLKGGKNQILGSWTLLDDGGAVFGLTNSDGIATTILRGGATPGLAFYNTTSIPIAALGLMQNVPHLLISGTIGDEGILIHGGKPSGMMVVDEKGKLKIFISKHGIFQGKEEPSFLEPKEKGKFFSFQEEIMNLYRKENIQ